MKSHRQTAILVIAGALVVAAIVAALPIWSASRQVKGIRVSAIVYEGGPLWKADLVKDSWARERNWVQAGFWVSVVTLGALFAYCRLVPKTLPDPVGDYEEKADGSIPDGRDAAS